MMNLVSKIPFFKPFDKEITEKLLSTASIVQIPAGRYVYKEDDIINFMYIIFSGSCLVTKKNNNSDPEIDLDPYKLGLPAGHSPIDSSEQKCETVTKIN